jgi:hypothetical protein
VGQTLLASFRQPRAKALFDYFRLFKTRKRGLGCSVGGPNAACLSTVPALWGALELIDFVLGLID